MLLILGVAAGIRPIAVAPSLLRFEIPVSIAAPANDNQRIGLKVFFPGLRPGDVAATELKAVRSPLDVP